MEDPRLAPLVAQTELEIRRLEEGRKEHGWSPWALIAALAAICWQLCSQLAAPHRWDQVGLYFALFVLLADLARGILAGLNSGVEPRKPGIRFYPANVVQSGTRAFRLFVAAKMAAAAVIICGVAPLVGWFRIVWLGMFGFYVVLILIVTGGTWTDMPLPVGTPPKQKLSGLLATVALWAVHLLLLASVLRSLVPGFIERYAAGDVQLALLGFGLMEMGGMLLAFQAIEPQRKRLVHLRRMMGLGEVGADEAKARLEEIIFGADIEVILKDRFAELREGLAKLESQLKEGQALMVSENDPREPKEFLPEARALMKTAGETFDHCELLLMQIWARSLAAKLAEAGSEVLAEYALLKEELNLRKKELLDLKAAANAVPAEDSL